MASRLALATIGGTSRVVDLLANYTPPGFNLYVDPTNGSDTGAGTSAAPYKTLTKAVAVATNGQSIGVKTGSISREPAKVAVTQNNLRIAAWGTGAAPIISGGTIITGWQAEAQTGTYSAATATTTMVTATDGNGTTPLYKGTDATSLAAGSFFYTGGRLYVNTGANPATQTIEGAQRDVISTTLTSGLTLDGLEFRHGYDRTVLLDNHTGPWLIRNCAVRYAGFNGQGNSICIQYSPNGQVLNCTFEWSISDGVYVHASQNVEVGYCTMPHIGALTGDTASDGIQFENTYSGGGNSDGLWVHHNTITLGTGSPKGCILVNTDAGTYPTASATGIVEHNTLTGGNFGVGVASSGVTVRYNTMANQVSTYGGGIHVANNFPTPITNCTIHHNLIYGGSRAGMIFQATTQPRSGWIIANNTIVDCAWAGIATQAPLGGTVANNIIWWTASNSPSFAAVQQYLDGGTALSLTWDYNLIKDNVASGYRGTGAGAYNTYSTLAAWRTGTGFDVHSVTGDPLFADTTNYLPQVGSPAVNAGTVVAGITDGYSGAAPDIGYSEVA